MKITSKVKYRQLSNKTVAVTEYEVTCDDSTKTGHEINEHVLQGAADLQEQAQKKAKKLSAGSVKDKMRELQ